MTKIAKNRVLTVLAVILAAMAAVTFGWAARRASGQQTETNSEKFIRIVKAFEGKEITDDLLVLPEAGEFAGIEKSAVYLYTAAYPEGLSDDEKAALPEDVVKLYNDVYAVFEEAYDVKLAIGDLFDFAHVTLAKDVMYAENSEVAALEERYGAMTENEKAFVMEYLVGANKQNLTLARKRLDEKKALIDAAVSAIANIEYYDAAAQEMATGAEGGETVLSSKTSINAAHEALTAVYERDIFSSELEGERGFITNLDVFTAADDALSAWEEKAAAVSAAIEAVYGSLSEEAGKEVYYTKREDIDAAKLRFDNLLAEDKRMNAAGDTNFNDLQSLIGEEIKGRLDEMIAKISEKDEEIDAVASLIGAIPAADELKFTAEHNTLIEAAETAFTALDNDIKENDAAVYAAGEGVYIVKGYADMIKARAAWYAWEKEVDGLVLATEEYIANFGAEGFDVVEEFTAIQVSLNAFTPEQKTAYEAAETEFNGSNRTCGFIIAYYQAEINKIRTAVMPVINLIAAIPSNATVTNEYNNALKAAEDAYNALPEQYKSPVNYVTNHAKLEQALSDYAELTADVTAWQNKLEEITLGGIHTGNMARVDESVALYGGISAEAKAVIEASVSGDVYYEDYQKYLGAQEEKEALLLEIKNIAAAMYALDGEQPDMKDIAAYDAAYQEVKAMFEELAETDRKWLAKQEGYFIDEDNTVSYKAAYEKYLSVIDNAAAVHAEVLIAAIPDRVTLADEAAIDAARAEYDENLTDAQRVKVRNYAKLTEAESALSQITAGLDEWAEKVTAMLNGGEVSELWSVDLDAVAELESAYAEFDAEEQNYVAKSYALLLDIKDRGAEAAAEVSKAIAALDSTAPGYLTKLKDIEDSYLALDASQQKLVTGYEEFKSEYNVYLYVMYLQSAIDELHAAVAEGGAITAENKVQYNAIAALYYGTADGYGIYIDAGYAAKLKEIEAAFASAEEISLADEIAALKDALYSETGIVAELEGLENDIFNLTDGLKVTLENRIQSLETELTAAIDKLTADLESAIKDLQAADSADKAELTGKIGELQAALNAAVKALEEADAANKTALESAIAAAKTELTAAVDKIAADLESAIEELQAADSADKAELTGKIGELQTALNAAVKALEATDAANKTALESAIAAAIEALKQELTEADAANKTALEEAIAAAIEALKQELTEADRELNDSIEAVKAKAQSNIIIVSVVFAVLILGLCACVAVLFKKAK